MFDLVTILLFVMATGGAFMILSMGIDRMILYFKPDSKFANEKYRSRVKLILFLTGLVLLIGGVAIIGYLASHSN